MSVFGDIVGFIFNPMIYLSTKLFDTLISGLVPSYEPGVDSMKPATLDSFSPTLCQEGAVVPLVFGKVRLRGNLLWFGNLVTEEIVQITKVDGGMFHSDKKIKTVVGYNYYLDMWQAVCEGRVQLYTIYKNDKVDVLSYALNPGDTDYIPPIPKDSVSALKGVAHIFFPRLFLGENSLSPPTLHFVVGRECSSVCSTALSRSMLSNGINPAAIILDLLMMGGAELSEINIPSFQVAADYWYFMGYGLNITFSEIGEVRDLIGKVLSYVDGCLLDPTSGGGKFELMAYRPTDSYVETLSDDDFIEFTFSRKSWGDTFNDLRGNYIDETADFTQRTVSAINAANVAIQGRTNQKTIDLTAFRTRESASRRLCELLESMSYPEASVSFAAHIRHTGLSVGQVIIINHVEYGLSNTWWRITEKTVSSVDSNDVSFKAVEMTSHIFSGEFQISGAADYDTDVFEPSPPLRQKLFEIPGNMTDHIPTWLILVARAGAETGYRIWVSGNGSDYSLFGEHTGFSLHGVLDQAYPVTFAIDDESEIVIAPTRNDPVFQSLSRGDLFAVGRVAIVGSEMIGFQTVSYDAGKIRLSGCIRGLFNTPVSSHAAGDQIWLTNIGNNRVSGMVQGNYVKISPYMGSDSVGLDQVSALTVASAPVVWPPSRVRAVRSGSVVAVTWWPRDGSPEGAGSTGPEAQTDQEPFLFRGDFVLSVPGGSVAVSGCSYSFSYAGSCSVAVVSRYNGRASAAKTLSVGSADGVYII